ncbi:hypothetical protein [Roseomonas indoligenes]|uniref:Cupin n=1 Tax=Roseomonas indoligenes TaxID=2820811 RepID=A0A940N1U9_9PROT|nr:hypothetical protein [Pararoseomonas indoligenes]MBP0493685.1 hypothetical protein [Pararoseomonas indoligenes]
MKGSLRIDFEDGPADLNARDFLAMPTGLRHDPVAGEECWVLLIEPASTRHTGDEVTPLTRSREEQVG